MVPENAGKSQLEEELARKRKHFQYQQSHTGAAASSTIEQVMGELLS